MSKRRKYKCTTDKYNHKYHALINCCYFNRGPISHVKIIGISATVKYVDGVRKFDMVLDTIELGYRGVYPVADLELLDELLSLDWEVVK